MSCGIALGGRKHFTQNAFLPQVFLPRLRSSQQSKTDRKCFSPVLECRKTKSKSLGLHDRVTGAVGKDDRSEVFRHAILA